VFECPSCGPLMRIIALINDPGLTASASSDSSIPGNLAPTKPSTPALIPRGPTARPCHSLTITPRTPRSGTRLFRVWRAHRCKRPDQSSLPVPSIPASQNRQQARLSGRGTPASVLFRRPEGHHCRLQKQAMCFGGIVPMRAREKS